MGFYTLKERAFRINKYKAKRDKRITKFGKPTRNCKGRGRAACKRTRVKGKFTKNKCKPIPHLPSV